MCSFVFRVFSVFVACHGSMDYMRPSVHQLPASNQTEDHMLRILIFGSFPQLMTLIGVALL
jgi:hypothetical protein